MVAEKKVGCMIFSVGEEFAPLAKCAIDSFKKWHPDVPVHFVNEDNIGSFKVSTRYPKKMRGHFGIFRFAIAAEIMMTEKYDKFIVLGSDTITCARMDEFMDNWTHDILVTLCSSHQLTLPYRVQRSNNFRDDFKVLSTPVLCVAHDRANETSNCFHYYGHIEQFQETQRDFDKEGVTLIASDYLYANSDVLCVNNPAVFLSILKFASKYWDDFHESREQTEFLTSLGFEFYADQGAINMVAALSLAHQDESLIDPQIISTLVGDLKMPMFSISYIEVPFIMATSLYNARAKKSIDEARRDAAESAHPHAHPECARQEGASILKYRVDGDKLFTVDNKQIKVWHYMAHLGLNTTSQRLGRVNAVSDVDDIEPTKKELAAAKHRFEDIVNSYIFGVFNEETKKFFKEHCACGTFFEKEFRL